MNIPSSVIIEFKKLTFITIVFHFSPPFSCSEFPNCLGSRVGSFSNLRPYGSPQQKHVCIPATRYRCRVVMGRGYSVCYARRRSRLLSLLRLSYLYLLD